MVGAARSGRGGPLLGGCWRRIIGEMRDPAADVATGDPIADLLAAGVLSDVDEAEEAYLDQHLGEIVALAESSLSDEEFRRHPLVSLLLARGSRGWEDSLR